MQAIQNCLPQDCMPLRKLITKKVQCLTFAKSSQILHFFIIIIWACVRLSVQCSSLQSLYLHKNMQNISIIFNLLKIITSTIHELHKHNSECSTFQIISTEKERFQKRLNLKKKEEKAQGKILFKIKGSRASFTVKFPEVRQRKGIESDFLEAVLWNATNGIAGYNSLLQVWPNTIEHWARRVAFAKIAGLISQTLTIACTKNVAP